MAGRREEEVCRRDAAGECADFGQADAGRRQGRSDGWELRTKGPAMAYHDATADHAAHDHRPSFLVRWLCSTNHKDIGTLYMCLAIFASVIAGGLSVIM